MIEPGATVSGDDIIIGKTAMIKSALDKEDDIMGETGAIAALGVKTNEALRERKDVSIQLKHSENGKVEQVALTVNGDGEVFAKVKMRSIRVP